MPVPQLGKESRQVSLYSGSEPFQMEANSSGGDSPALVKLSYNWVTPPGMLPDGWPEDVELMPGLDTRYGFVDESGFLNAIVSGPGSLEPVATYYSASLTDWTSVGMADSSGMIGDNLSLLYSSGNRLVRVNGQVNDGQIILWIGTGEMSE